MFLTSGHERNVCTVLDNWIGRQAGRQAEDMDMDLGRWHSGGSGGRMMIIILPYLTLPHLLGRLIEACDRETY